MPEFEQDEGLERVAEGEKSGGLGMQGSSKENGV